MSPKLVPVLTRAQQEAVDRLLESLAISPAAVLRGGAGAGKTNILKTLQATQGGKYLDAEELMYARCEQGPASIEEVFIRLIEDAIQSHGLVLVDDVNVVTDAITGAGDDRVHMLDAALTAILAEARVLRRKLIFAVEKEIPWPIRRRARIVEVADH